MLSLIHGDLAVYFRNEPNHFGESEEIAGEAAYVVGTGIESRKWKPASALPWNVDLSNDDVVP